MTPDLRNPALEAAIASDPFDRESYRVYADWLEGQGDIRAKLISLQCSPDPEQHDGKAVRKLLAAHEASLLGPLARLGDRLRWKYGFIHGATIGRESGGLSQNIANLFEHPSGRFLVELGIWGIHLDSEVALLARAPATLRALSLEQQGLDEAEEPAILSLESIVHVIERLMVLAVYGAISLEGVPLASLKKLAIATDGARLKLAGGIEHIILKRNVEVDAIDLPRLLHAQFELFDMTPSTAAAITNAHWPALQRLFFARPDPDLLAPLFQRSDMPALERLTIRRASNPSALAALLRDAPFARHLVHLELSEYSLDDDAARILAGAKFPKLQSLNVTENHLTPASYAALDKLGLHVLR